MLKKFAPAILVLIVACLAAPSAFAMYGAKGKWWTRPEVAQKLSLSDEEKARLDELYVESERKRIDLKSAVAKQRFDLTQVMENPESGEKEIMEQYDTLQKAQDELAAERFRFLLGVRSTIGAERFRRLSEMFEEFRRNRAARWQNNMQQRPGPPGQFRNQGTGAAD